ncbi:unnamed protein product [Triticum turgidum subsp. durum]|uniref:MORN repeat-containing protein n=1 Tax=Triticum turgidum subsp. durum TaxID=4567 RepID=A0A9R1PDN4_TRITD|nr:unnamed protein product [Triticum turgidum subsp. durum]
MPSDSWQSNAGRGRARAPASEEAWQEMVVLLQACSAPARSTSSVASPNGEFYIWQWRVGVPYGAGMYLWTDRWMYEGEWRHGPGQVLLAVGPGVTLEGEFKDGFMDGDDTYTGAAGDRYKGSWSMNLKHGNGRNSYVKDDQ